MVGLARKSANPRAPSAGPAARMRNFRVPLPGDTTKPGVSGAEVPVTRARVDRLANFPPVAPTSYTSTMALPAVLLAPLTWAV